MSAAITIGAILATLVGAFEAWRKWRDLKRERVSIWMGYDHGSDAYADLCDGAAGNAGEISRRGDA